MVVSDSEGMSMEQTKVVVLDGDGQSSCVSMNGEN